MLRILSSVQESMFNVQRFWYIYIGKDCIGCAKTGSGKTATFALPILDHLSRDPYGVFALVITPTR